MVTTKGFLDNFMNNLELEPVSAYVGDPRYASFIKAVGRIEFK